MRGKHARPRTVLPSSAFALACCLAAFLLCAGLCVGSSAAKYVERSSAEDSARVAGIVVNATASGNGGSHTIALGGDSVSSATYSFTVSNKSGGKVSEVAYGYDIVVKATGDTDGLTVGLDGGGSSQAFSGDEITFEDVGVLPAGVEDSEPHTLTFFANGADSASADKSVTFKVSVHAEQID